MPSTQRRRNALSNPAGVGVVDLMVANKIIRPADVTQAKAAHFGAEVVTASSRSMPSSCGGASLSVMASSPPPQHASTRAARSRTGAATSSGWPVRPSGVRATSAGANALLILAARHPERFAEVAALVETLAFRLVRRSLWSGEPLAGSVFLLDSIGELAALYSLATVAFVGGSLVPRGGHNILEPALYGVPIVTGNHYENFREIVTFFLNRDAVRVVGVAELPLVFMELIENQAEREELGSNALAALDSQRGATGRTVAALVQLMADRRSGDPA